MIVIVKTLDSRQFTIDIEPEMTISQVKSLISNSCSDVPLESQKLIFAVSCDVCPLCAQDDARLELQGGVMENDKLIDDYGVKENGFIVCMTKKRSKAAAASPVNVQASVDGLGAAAVVAEACPPASASVAAPVSVEAQYASSSMNDVVSNIVAVTGVSEDKVRSALRAANDDADLAVEFLSGENQVDESGFELHQDDAQDDAQRLDNDLIQGCSLNQIFRDHPQFAQLRTLVQSNPADLESFMEQRMNPEMLEALEQDPQGFMTLVSEEDMRAGQVPRGANMDLETSLSDDETASITRLQALGFDRDMVLEAFRACDKNEQLAANFLLNSMS